MKHPGEAELALYAAGDLGWLREKLFDRHVDRCEECQIVVVEYSEFRPEVKHFPPLRWHRLSLEMEANIRLGLAAGECVSPQSVRPFRSALSRPAPFRLATLFACSLLAGLAGVGIMMRLDWQPLLFGARPIAGPVLEASESGLQVREGGRSLRMLNTSGKDVNRSVGSRGQLGARYLDPNTGYVTISQIYGE